MPSHTMISLSHVLREVGALNIQPDSPQAVHKTMKPPSSPSYSTTPSLSKSRSHASERSEHEDRPDIVFSTTHEIPDDLEELWTLKRATPIDEDEEPWLASPSKRIRRTLTFFDPVPESRDDEEESHHRIKELSSSVQIHEEKDGFTVVLL